MPTSKLTTYSRDIREINGVALFTRAEKQRSRYSDEERLQIMGATQKDLDAFIELFCPRQPLYAMTRAGSDDPRDWTTPRGRIRPSDVLRHLQGNCIPTQSPRWVAPRSWEITHWVGIDVDYRGDSSDFQQRRNKVYKALNQIGVVKKRRLVSPTPSGGIHVRFFLSRPVKVVDAVHLLELVGLKETSGQIELFPKLKKGMRLPFGFIPGQEFDSQAWLNFIRSYQAGKIPLVDWLKCMKRAEKYAYSQACKNNQTSIAAGNQMDTEAGAKSCQAARPAKRRQSSVTLGTPKHQRNKNSENCSVQKERYQRLLQNGCRSTADAKAIWNLGIQMTGTRVAATNVLAWHLVRVKRLSKSDATTMLTDWVYETGAETSADVRADIQNDTREVALQTAEIVAWCDKLGFDENGFSRTRSQFSQAEVDHVISLLSDVAVEKILPFVKFALRFLGFAKLNGELAQNGWETAIAVNAVIRKWPGCSGMNYKPRIELLKKVGLIKMTREKLQRPNKTGRARTYEIHVAPRISAEALMPLADAIEYAAKAIAEKTTVNKAPSDQTMNDTYKRFEHQTPLKKTRKVIEEVELDTESSNATTNVISEELTPLPPNLCESSLFQRQLEVYLPRPRRHRHWTPATKFHLDTLKHNRRPDMVSMTGSEFFAKERQRYNELAALQQSNSIQTVNSHEFSLSDELQSKSAQEHSRAGPMP